MKYAWLVAVREYLENIQTKGFWIGIAFVPVLAFASVKVPMMLKAAKPMRNFAVVDPSGEFTSIIDAAIASHYERKKAEALNSWKAQHDADPATPPFEPPRPFYKRVPLPPAYSDGSVQDLPHLLRPWLLGERKIDVDGEPQDLFALVVLPKSELLLKSHIEYWCTNLADTDLREAITRGVADELKNREYVSSGVDRKKIEKITKLEVDLDEKDPRKAAGDEKVDPLASFRQWAPLGFVYVMFIAIVTIAQMLIASTIEEKSNRIVEVLLSSVTPGELMFGKLVGVAGVGLTMLAAWTASIWAVMTHFVGDARAKQFASILFDASLIGPFLVYFLLGYTLYASILLALGSMCNTLKDAQNFMAPVMMVLMVPLLTMTFVARDDPNGPLAVFLSWVPPFTPFVMMNRAAAHPPMLDVIGSGVLLVVAILVTIWFAGRVFKNGILRTGEPPKLFELVKLMRRSS
jgi:ABC-2 type transport system permease protein